jgi:hypothetical protein
MLKRFVAVVASLDGLAHLVVGQFEFRPHLVIIKKSIKSGGKRYGQRL